MDFQPRWLVSNEKIRIARDNGPKLRVCRDGLVVIVDLEISILPVPTLDGSNDSIALFQRRP